jgi:phage baseplate assembly protein W
MAIVKNTPIGINLPIRDGKGGYFDQSTDTFTAIRMNIINLLRTNPGERRMNPIFGTRLWNIVFEPNDQFISDKVNKIVTEDINQWIPGITVNSINVETFENDGSANLKDIYKLYITIIFTIDSINQSDTMDIVLNVNKV